MVEQQIDKYVASLKERAAASRAEAEEYERQVAFLTEEEELLGKFGQLPLAMQVTQFIIEQIAATATGSAVAVTTGEHPPERSDEVSLGRRITRLRPRTRPITSRGEQAGDGTKRYNIAPQVKHMMNAILGGGPDAIPETLDQLFDRMYSGQDWRHSRTVFVPMGIGRGHQRIPYGEDLAAPNSVIRGLIRGADRIICERMRGNSDPLFAHRERKAASELIQIYRKVETVGWEVYDGFMARNAIREAHAGS